MILVILARLVRHLVSGDKRAASHSRQSQFYRNFEATKKRFQLDRGENSKTKFYAPDVSSAVLARRVGGCQNALILISCLITDDH